jgi:porin
MIYREPGRPEQGLAVYARLGFADSDVNQFSNYIGAGAVYTGLLPGRDEDRLGLALAVARNGEPFKDALRAAGARVFDQEIIIELTYRAEVTPWLTLQPDIQYAMNPGAGANGDLDDALVVGLRFELNPF